MAERLKALDLKSSDPERGPWVRIPLAPFFTPVSFNGQFSQSPGQEDSEREPPMDNHPIELDLSPENSAQPQGHTISVEKIREMVELFYSRTQQDELLGPIFADRVSDWDAHYEKMTRFWSSATMRAGTYSGRPIEAHRFGGFTKAHFDRWIELFTKSTHDIFEPSDAAIFVKLGKNMASSISMRIGVGRLELN